MYPPVLEDTNSKAVDTLKKKTEINKILDSVIILYVKNIRYLDKERNIRNADNKYDVSPNIKKVICDI